MNTVQQAGDLDLDLLLETTSIMETKQIVATTQKKKGGSPPLKPPKKFRDEEEEIQRCKRRLDFHRLGLHNLQKTSGVGTSRRNERERNRVKLINHTFATLREHVPYKINSKGKNKKLSKVDTLKAAIDYIQDLQELLDENDPVSAVFSNPHFTQQPTNVYQNTLQTQCSYTSSQSPGGSACSISDTASEAPLSPDESDLLDSISSWLHYEN